MDRCPGCGGPLPSSPWDDQEPAYCRRCRRGDAPTDTVHVVWNCPDCGTGYRGQAFAERCCDGGTFSYDTADPDLRADGGLRQRDRRKPREETMWYCPECETWNGWKLDVCLGCKTPQPRFPVHAADVDANDARNITLLDRLKAKVGWH